MLTASRKLTDRTLVLSVFFIFGESYPCNYFLSAAVYSYAAEKTKLTPPEKRSQYVAEIFTAFWKIFASPENARF